MLEHCPFSLGREIWEAVRWWEDWHNMKILPDGGTDRMLAPYYVHETIRLCDSVRAQVLAEKAGAASRAT